MLSVEQSRVPGLGGGGEVGWQRLSGQCGSRLELLGIPGAPSRLADGGAHDVGHHFVRHPAECLLVAMLDDRRHVVGTGRHPAADSFDPSKHFDEFLGRHCLPVRRSELMHGRLQPGEGIGRRDGTHVRKICRYPDRRQGYCRRNAEVSTLQD